jgi:ParB family chromosome partitioning protein
MEQQALDDLAASIREHGVIQPILVKEIPDGYQLVAGERRVRASEMAGLERIPALVRDIADRAQLELALVENVQRADLGPIEEALAYRQLADEFGLTQETIAVRVGRSRSSVANTLRLLELSPAVQEALTDASITEGHGRAIGTITDGSAQRELLAVVIARGLSVRQTEELARRLKDRPATAPRVKAASTDPDLERLEGELRAALGTKVSLVSSRRGGRIVIEYYDGDDLGRLYERLVGVSL